MAAGSSFASLPMCPELAKAIAQCLFKEENRMLRFDSSELSRAGATNAPRQRSDVFDAMEKAYPPVFDLFL